MSRPKVLISDALSDTAVAIFRDRGLDVTFEPDLGKDKERLEATIGEYDGLAIRSATQVTEKILKAASKLKVIGETMRMLGGKGGGGGGSPGGSAGGGQSRGQQGGGRSAAPAPASQPSYDDGDSYGGDGGGGGSGEDIPF